MTAPTPPKLPTPEERAAKVANSLRRTWKLNLGFGSNAATEIAAEIRSASSAARKAALEEAAAWHASEATRLASIQTLTDQQRFHHSIAHECAAAHLRALAAPAQEKA